jgi:CBS domain-containing protein
MGQTLGLVGNDYQSGFGLGGAGDRVGRLVLLVSRSDLLPLVAAALLVVVAGVVASLEVALSRVSRVRVEELVREGSRGAPRLQSVLTDPPRALNLLLLLRMLLELSAVGIVIAWTADRVDGALAVLLAVVVMTVVLYVFVGVGPRTIGRQQSERVALLGAGPVLMLTRLLGPCPALLIMLGNAITPGKGFREGPFASEAELRDLVELAQERGVVERRERDMINSVFELGDTLVREVMVPRTDIVSIERGKTVRQAMNLLLRSGFSRVPVVGDNADDVLGPRLPQGPRAPRARRRRRRPQGRGGHAQAGLRAGQQARRRAAARDAARPRAHRRRRRRVRRHRRPGDHRGRARGDRRRDPGRVRPRGAAGRGGRRAHPPGHRAGCRSTTSRSSTASSCPRRTSRPSAGSSRAPSAGSPSPAPPSP